MNSQAPLSSGSHGLATSVDEFLPQLVFKQSDFQPDGPIAALRLELELPAEGATAESARALAELLHSLNDQDVALGGQGLVMDQRASRLEGGKVSLLLRPLEALGSLERLRQLAKTLTATVCSEVQSQPSRQPAVQNDVPAVEFFDRLRGFFLRIGRQTDPGSTQPNPWPRLSVQVVA